ncbi:hypothetical protein [Paraburkholderia humisilvae]|uniref:Hydroxyacylglutathione hydrolase n=1 Tax=Paraburkholderia humisilvae TaxID=627669 RepID=A0A6J5DJ73_9BURK|nr:hypothetical protein [Paraburkholderia humisilvae]CAB3752946.1 hypothetical protein LMG29542_01926 [Paraburkholderia humisilvae]
MKVTMIPVTPFQQNSSLLVCAVTGRAVVVDPGGDLDIIQRDIWPLGDDVTLVPGHGPTSTFGNERRTHPYVADGVRA